MLNARIACVQEPVSEVVEPDDREPGAFRGVDEPTVEVEPQIGSPGLVSCLKTSSSLERPLQ